MSGPTNNDLVFGPVPSRRLGFSLGINNIPPKVCSYACIYCQLGKAIKMQATRESFYMPEQIFNVCHNHLKNTEQKIDYLTLVSDGEPTLDKNIGKLISLLKGTNIPVAVITNSSLISNPKVREDLRMADLVSLKLDSALPDIWRKINKPVKSLDLESIQEGMELFARKYKGKLITETMLVKGLNDTAESLTSTAEFLKKLQPHTSYLAIPTRPPAQPGTEAPSEENLNKGMQIFSEYLPSVEYLIGYEGNTFAGTGNPRQDLLGILSVHPMREDAVDTFLKKYKAEGNILREMLVKKEITRTSYKGNNFYVRTMKKH